MNWTSATRWEIARAVTWFIAISAAVLSTEIMSTSSSVLGGVKPPCDSSQGAGACVATGGGGVCNVSYFYCDYEAANPSLVHCFNSSGCLVLGCHMQSDTMGVADTNCR